MPLLMEIIAHRGQPLTNDQNTIAAFNRALDCGATGFECDVVLTADGQPVCCHPQRNRSLFALTGLNLNISTTTWEELTQVTVGGEHIPHLHEVLSLVKSRKCACFLEPKWCENDLVEKIVRSVRAYGVEEQVQILTFATRRELLRISKNLEPRIKTAVILVAPVANWEMTLDRCCADNLVLGWKVLNQYTVFDLLGLRVRSRIARLRQTGKQIYGGLANDPQSIKWLLNQNVDGIFTDKVEMVARLAGSSISAITTS